MINDLKPCPFCGGEEEWDEKNKAPQCSKCLATIPSDGVCTMDIFLVE